MALDALTIGLTLFLLVEAHTKHWPDQYTVAVLIAALAFGIFGEIGGLYCPWRGETIKRQFFHVTAVWLATLGLLLLLAFAFKVSSSYSRLVIGTWLVLTPLALGGWRVLGGALLKRAIIRGNLRRKAIVWGTSEQAEQLAAIIGRSPWLGLDLVDHVHDEQPAYLPAAPPVNASAATNTAPLEQLVLQAKRGDFDILYIALPLSARARISDLINRLADTTATVYMVPDYFTTDLFHGRWSNLEGIPLISVYDTPFWGVNGWLKRATDILFASLFLLVAALPMLFLAAAVKLSSPGPVIFKQRRYGMNGQQIMVWKFRTMRVCQDGANVPQATQHDPRVTRLGAFMRRTSLDELPQFINVLTGQMSIVGPRPHPVALNEQYRGQITGYMLRHKVRPGITGWAQINGWRGETETLHKMAKRVEHDLWYVRNWSLWLDLKIMLLTACRGLTGPNAY